MRDGSGEIRVQHPNRAASVVRCMDNGSQWSIQLLGRAVRLGGLGSSSVAIILHISADTENGPDQVAWPVHKVLG
jgi:hypothetical protein